MFSIDGLVSGLDTTSIIEGLLSIQQRQVDQMDQRKTDIQVRQTAFQGIEANVIALQSASQQLGSFTNDVFSVFSATSSDEDVIQASANSDATSGTYQLRVTQLATAAQSASQSYASSNASITEGDLSIQVGNKDVTTITIDSENNTLEGLAESINTASDDVSATVINEGSGYRLLLSSRHTGETNQINVTNNTGAGDSQVDFSGDPVQLATNSEVTLGSGTGAINISRSTNTIEDVVPGLTLNLASVDANKDITISVQKDNEAAIGAIEGFVTAFNNVMTYIDEQTGYNAESEQGGILLGNSSTNGIRDALRNTLARTIGNVDSSVNRLSTIGITFDDRGQLAIDSGKLSNALSGTLDGVDSTDVRRLFAMDGQSTSSGISFVSGAIETQTPSDSIGVNITKAAERASITATSAIGGTIKIDDTNDRFSIEIDGVSSGELRLNQGTFSQAELAEHLESVINESSELGGRDVSVSVENDQFSIESVVYGTRSEVGEFTGTAAQELGFAGDEYSRGKDVAGYFVVDGVTESATGNGQILSGSSGNANTDGLQLHVTLNASQISGVHNSDLTLSRGFASNIESLVDDLLDPDTGRFSQAIDSFEEQIESVDDSINRLNSVFESRQQQLINEFVGIESRINSLQTTSSFLASQLGGVSVLAGQ